MVPRPRNEVPDRGTGTARGTRSGTFVDREPVASGSIWVQAAAGGYEPTTLRFGCRRLRAPIKSHGKMKRIQIPQLQSSTPAALQLEHFKGAGRLARSPAAAMAFGSSGKRKRSEVATQHEDDQAGRDGSDNEAANVDETDAGEEYITIEHEEEERADIGKRNPLLDEVTIIEAPKGKNDEDYSGIEKTGEAIAEFLLNAIEEIGPANVLQVVTDNASNCKAAGKEIQKAMEGLGQRLKH
ncbi:hypothetical protein E2562_034224 [Oryza meyeriana var. granulata]|uniref:DUF659 domain-containing protein n=1 Tax=Oryza meyeriana var. granulata TaxID=110450 RepID=A0A6G1CC13_9ORYZ|nr:hypothetical protein E2562_034224 [Oryza meyeriana var. granulata]